MFKSDLYTEIVRTLNLNTQSVAFKGGYIIAIYDNYPYVHEVSTLNAFDFVKSTVIPVSEEISQETPSVNLADRSDYIFQYKIMFKATSETEVLTSLEEFRTYWFANKQVTIDGYVTAIKTSRGDKQGNIRITNGDFYSFYTIKVFATAIKDGYIKKDTDLWKIRLNSRDAVTAGSFVVGIVYKITTSGTTDFTLIGAADSNVGTIFTATGVGTGTGTATPETYQTLKLDRDQFAITMNPIFSNASEVAKAWSAGTNSNNKIRCFYDSTVTDKILYSTIMNKEDKDQLWDFVHIFDGVTFSYKALIVGGVRTLLDNGIVLLEFDWTEADV